MSVCVCVRLLTLCNVYLPSLVCIICSFARTDGRKMRWLAFCGGFFSSSFTEMYVRFFLFSIYWLFVGVFVLISTQREIRNATFETGTNQPTIVIMMQLKTNLVIHCVAVTYQFCMATATVSGGGRNPHFFVNTFIEIKCFVFIASHVSEL